MESNSLTLDDVSRLLGLVIAVADDEKCSFSEAIRLIAESRNVPHVTQADRAALAEFMGRTRRIRIERNKLLGAPLFRDPSFDMLLELFAADQRHQQISVTSLCYASGVPMTTALRHLGRLEEHGLVVREGDRLDNRRCYVRPTPKAVAGLEFVFGQWLAAWTHLMDRIGENSG